MNVLRSSFTLNGRPVLTSSSSSSSSSSSKSSAVVVRRQSTADHHPTNGRRPSDRDPVVVVVAPWQTTALPSRQDVQRIALSAAPYLLFLLLYGINPYIRLLPVATDIGSADLRNVSAWEEYLFPSWQLHVVVSSVHFLPLDFLAAVPYLGHYAIPVLYPAFLYLSHRLELILQFYRLLGLTMWGHYVIWLVAPTLPPWALDFLTAHQKSNASSMAETILTAHKEGPAFARIDSFIGSPFFHGMFVGNPVPFGSFPSGHVAWPLCILLTLPEHLRWRFSVYVVWVSWATLYTGHHYTIDVVGALALVCGLTKLISHVTTQSRPSCSPLQPP